MSIFSLICYNCKIELINNTLSCQFKQSNKNYYQLDEVVYIETPTIIVNNRIKEMEVFKYYITIAVVCALTITICSGGNRSLILSDIDAVEEEHFEYTQVILYMVKRFVTPRTNTLIIMENCIYDCYKHRTYHRIVLRYFLENLNYTLSTQLFFGQIDDQLWDYNMLLVPRWWDFR